MRSIFFALLVLVASCKSGPSDNELQTGLTSTLSASYPGVMASVKDGVATLTGTCPDESCKNSAESAAKGMKGVKSVVNNITVAPPPPPPVEITADTPLKDSLNSLLSAYKTVNADVSNGVVTLTGTIKRSQLTTLMQSVQELKPKKVNNQLVIK